mmetsp:Transcript_32923/g.60661  ORF Transcript_32923/g.60661 Transcript_32923/m.60661 type:complete len:338 (+) Transcript_32923:553-1566(+)
MLKHNFHALAREQGHEVVRPRSRQHIPARGIQRSQPREKRNAAAAAATTTTSAIVLRSNSERHDPAHQPGRRDRRGGAHRHVHPRGARHRREVSHVGVAVHAAAVKAAAHLEPVLARREPVPVGGTVPAEQLQPQKYRGVRGSILAGARARARRRCRFHAEEWQRSVRRYARAQRYGLRAEHGPAQVKLRCLSGEARTVFHVPAIDNYDRATLHDRCRCRCRYRRGQGALEAKREAMTRDQRHGVAAVVLARVLEVARAVHAVHAVRALRVGEAQTAARARTSHALPGGVLVLNRIRMRHLCEVRCFRCWRWLWLWRLVVRVQYVQRRGDGAFDAEV